MRKIKIRASGAVTSLAFAGLLATAASAQAGGTIKIDDTKWVSIGAGLRTSFSSVEDAAPSGSDNSSDFSLENMRLYLGGQIHDNIRLTYNTEYESGNNSATRVLDAIVQLEFSDAVNIWLGRFLPPSDRSNLDGPYYLNAWDFPIAQRYPALFAGRDDGIALWGQPGNKRFKYQVGMFEGRDGGANQKDNPLYAARLTYNFWEPEVGYYNSSTYYGAQDVLTVGVAMMQQSDGAGTQATPGDFSGWNVDVLAEKTLAGGGVATLEGAYYDYDLDGVSDATLQQGSSYLLLGSYLLPGKVGIGRFQPLVRVQNFDQDGPGETDRYDVALNYIIDGHNARLSLIYANTDDGSTDVSSVKLAAQVQI